MSFDRAIEATLGEAVVERRPLAGGAGGDASRVRLASGREVFIKSSTSSPASLFVCEAAGLSWLAEANAIRLPEVIGVHEGDPPFIALELLTSGRPAADHDEQLGRQLAALHRAEPPCFGLSHDNFVGPLPQRNDPASADTFAAFHRERRLLPLVQSQRDRGVLDARTAAAVLAVADRLEQLVPEEPPARLHGDLWSGNAMVGPEGEPVLIDPSVYGGHREIDLGMMQLFGGFSRRVFAAYDEAHPLAPGWQERIPLMQLYPLLVHVALFGGNYVGQLARAAAAFA